MCVGVVELGAGFVDPVVDFVADGVAHLLFTWAGVCCRGSWEEGEGKGDGRLEDTWPLMCDGVDLIFLECCAYLLRTAQYERYMRLSSSVTGATEGCRDEVVIV